MESQKLTTETTEITEKGQPAIEFDFSVPSVVSVVSFFMLSDNQIRRAWR